MENPGKAEHSYRVWREGASAESEKSAAREAALDQEKEDVRKEEVEAIKALREKVAALREADIQIKMLKEQIENTPDDTLPALTGERVKKLKEVQQRVGEDDVTEKLAEYEGKLKRAEARYKTVFPNSSLE